MSYVVFYLTPLSGWGDVHDGKYKIFDTLEELNEWTFEQEAIEASSNEARKYLPPLEIDKIIGVFQTNTGAIKLPRHDWDAVLELVDCYEEMEIIFGEEAEKEKRKQQYEQLKEEFA